MKSHLSAEEAAYRLLAAAWDPQGLPPAEAIPWPEVLRLVERANLGALLHVVTAGVPKGTGASLPADVGEALEQAFYRSAAANTRCLHQLAQMGAALSALGAPLLLLKGAALAETLYGDSALRPIGDIDLLVRRADVPACREALLERGYVPRRLEERPGSTLAYHNQELFEPPAPYRAPVELHWHIVDVPYHMRRVDIDWFWRNSEERSVAGQPFRVLNPEANLVYLSAHLALHHRLRGLHSLLDLALLIVQERERIDWERIAAVAQSFELLAALRGTLDRLGECWPSLPLDELRRALQALMPSRMDARLFRLLTAESRSPTLQFYTTLVSLPGLAARARFVWLNVFPNAAYMKDRYGIEVSWQLPYWYLYRLGDGAAKMARTVRQALRLNA